tara:strand:- start:209 stop:541 length:333 start_codon:yes stop_codon:yes gene_type:complete
MNIQEYIQLEKLDTNNRKRELVYKRFYMFAYLRKTYGYSLQKIGKLFSRSHATIIHGINEYEYFKEDKLFKEITEEIRQDFPMGVIPNNDLLSSMYQILGQQNLLINKIK